MADDIELNEGTGGATVATDEVAGRHFQKVKPVVGDDGAEPRVITDDLGMPQLLTPKTFQGGVGDGLFTFMTDDGLPPTEPVAGSNANGNRDFSDTGEGLTYFFTKPAPGRYQRIAEFIVTIRDNGSMDSGSYGNGLTLVNGIRVVLGTGDPTGTPTILLPVTPLRIFTNPDWGRYTLGLIFSNFGAGDEYLSARFEATTNRGSQYNGLFLNGDEDMWFGVELHDDFTSPGGGLIEHLFFIQGIDRPLSELAPAATSTGL